MLDASHLSTVKYMYKWGCLENTDPKTQTVRLSKNLENADLENTDLENADLENTDLENADLETADLENADLENVVCLLIEKLRSFIKWMGESRI